MSGSRHCAAPTNGGFNSCQREGDKFAHPLRPDRSPGPTPDPTPPPAEPSIHASPRRFPSEDGTTYGILFESQGRNLALTGCAQCSLDHACMSGTASPPPAEPSVSAPPRCIQRHCQANMAHIRQSGPNSGLDCQGQVLALAVR